MQLNRKGLCVLYSLWFFTFVHVFTLCQSEKIRYASKHDCDRYSLDAVYHEKYKPITNNIFADTKEFVGRVSDLVAESLTSIMAELPDRHVSDNQEKKVYTQFKNVKAAFASKVKKVQRNITSSWEELVNSNFDLLYDNGKSSLEDYMNKTLNVADSYAAARRTLDSVLSSFIDFIKGTIRDGLSGIRTASEETIKKEEKEKEKEKKNKTEEATENNDQKEGNKEDKLRDKMSEITKMIVPGFLGKITLQVVEKKMDLSKLSGISPENRDSVLDDIVFDVTMIKNRIRAFAHSDIPLDKGSTDLARRSIYTFWADTADEMYKEKIQSKKSTEPSEKGRLYYRNLWKDEEQLMETLLNLMELFP